MSLAQVDNKNKTDRELRRNVLRMKLTILKTPISLGEFHLFSEHCRDLSGSSVAIGSATHRDSCSCFYFISQENTFSSYINKINNNT